MTEGEGTFNFMAFMFKLLAGGSFIGNKNEKRERRKMTYVIGIAFL